MPSSDRVKFFFERWKVFVCPFDRPMLCWSLAWTRMDTCISQSTTTGSCLWGIPSPARWLKILPSFPMGSSILKSFFSSLYHWKSLNINECRCRSVIPEDAYSSIFLAGTSLTTFTTVASRLAFTAAPVCTRAQAPYPARSPTRRPTCRCSSILRSTTSSMTTATRGLTVRPTLAGLLST